MKKLKIYIIIYLLITSIILPQTEPVSKTGGICFRIDDNGLISQYRDYVNIFEKHGQKFTFAMNLGLAEFNSVGYADSIKKFQQLGHELMDHTPNHRTNYFTTIFNVHNYENSVGVSHIIGNKICLKHNTPDTLSAINSDTVTIYKDTLYFNSGIFSNIDQGEERYFYIPDLDTTLLVVNYGNNKAIVTDIWDEAVNFDSTDSIKFFSFVKHDISLTTEALKILTNETKLLAQNYNLTPPKIWIQPGGNFPVFHAYDIKQPFENIGYTAGATYPEAAKKVFNEYNPNDDRQFAIQWGDFIEDEYSFEKLKKIIADGTAKHRVLIGNSHWYSGDINKWNQYIAKNDSLLDWATQNNIPIKTYSEWSDLLYKQTANPYENIIPPLNVDKDSNNIPDGYENVLYPVSGLTGTLIDDTTTIDGKAYKSIYYNDYKQITFILKLGGIEKGENDFSIYTKGDSNNNVRVVFSAPWPGNFYKEFVFPANSNTWRMYDLSQSINGNTSLVIPDTLSEINIDIYHQSTDPKPIYISGMNMAKKIAKDSLSINVLNPKPYLTNKNIKLEISLFDEFGNPATSSYDYLVSFPDTSKAKLVGNPVLHFDNSAKDTITIKCEEDELVDVTVSLVNNPSVSTTEQIQFVYPELFVKIKAFLEGSYDSTNNKMEANLINIPLVSPYQSAIDSVNNIPNSVIDWVLVSLREDIDNDHPNPGTSQVVIQKSAFIKSNGDIIDPHTKGKLGFRVKHGKYYIQLNHRNHLSILSAHKIELSD